MNTKAFSFSTNVGGTHYTISPELQRGTATDLVPRPRRAQRPVTCSSLDIFHREVSTHSRILPFQNRN
jgi:hypothetical protein